MSLCISKLSLIRAQQHHSTIDQQWTLDGISHISYSNTSRHKGRARGTLACCQLEPHATLFRVERHRRNRMRGLLLSSAHVCTPMKHRRASAPFSKCSLFNVNRFCRAFVHSQPRSKLAPFQGDRQPLDYPRDTRGRVWWFHRVGSA